MQLSSQPINWKRVAILFVVGLALTLGIGYWAMIRRYETPSSNAGGTAREVTAAEFGEAWPFTVDSGVVRCEADKRVVFIANNTIYALNTRAIVKFTGESILPIQRLDPTNDQRFISLQPIIDIGESLCK
jgi:hypothetical protein